MLLKYTFRKWLDLRFSDLLQSESPNSQSSKKRHKTFLGLLRNPAKAKLLEKEKEGGGREGEEEREALQNYRRTAKASDSEPEDAYRGASNKNRGVRARARSLQPGLSIIT